jgi:hypothetical protein
LLWKKLLKAFSLEKVLLIYSSRPRVPSYTIGRDRGEEWPRVLRVSTDIQHPPTISYGEAKWKQKKGMDGETRKKLGKRCKRRTMHLTIN